MGSIKHCTFQTSDTYKTAEYNTNGISGDIKSNSGIGVYLILSTWFAVLI